MSEASGEVVRGWRGALQAFGTRSALTLFFFGFGCGLPFFLVGNTLAIWLRDAGWELGPIGLVSYLTFFYVFKFMWAPLLDSRSLPGFGRLGRRRGWLLAAQLSIAAGLAALALTGPVSSVPLFLALAGFTALAGATQDTMVDAYRVEIAPIEMQGALAATYTLGYRIGLQLCGGALVLYLADFAGWRIGYLAMAGFALIPALATLLSPEPPPGEGFDKAARPSFVDAYVKPFAEFFRRHGWVLGLVLLAFVGLFKLPDQMLSIAGPFYLDTGFTKSDIATVSKLYGVWMGIGGAFLGGMVVAAIGVRKSLLIAAIAVAVSNLLFILMSMYPGQLWTFVATISGDNLSQGFAGTVLVSFLASLVDKRYTATQYALLSSLANLPGKLIGGFSGFIVEASSYTTFFVISSVSVIPTLLLLAWLWNRIVVDTQTDARGANR
ncbi:MAG TPA: MFS transporter [Dokdonella sp.]|uniref:AmpG family muropeptide MFS transporter n=1 Tax=Dokdonella sp. TaxID=2291710 RepID=UPI002D809F17|nr:MFS transporter [Dokdonella sp.]HET9031310.1 MFS transporter [Dokdonella sp.]